MKHGIYYAYWADEWFADYCYYIDKVARLGFDVLEIGCSSIPDYSDEQIRKLKKHADANNITLSGGYGPTPNHNIGSKNPQIRQVAFEWYVKLFEKMAHLNMHFLGGELYYCWPINFNELDSKEEEQKRSIESTQKLADLAAPYEITLGMEAISRYDSYLINTAEECIQFVQTVDKANVKVMLDTFHMNIEEDDIGGAIRSAGSLLGHLHTCEANRKVPGKGHIPWREIGIALKDIKYDGMVVMEPFVKMSGTVGKDIKVWRDVSCGADETALDKSAEEALRFQRYMLD